MERNAVIIKSVEKFLKDINNSKISPPNRFEKINRLYYLILNYISDDTQVLFTSTFARLSYIKTAFHIPRREMYLLHTFRKIDEKQEIGVEAKSELGLCCTQILLSHWLGQESPDADRIDKIYKNFSSIKRVGITRFRRVVSVQVQEIHLENQSLIAQLHEEPYDSITVDMSLPDRNDDYKSLLENLYQLSILPIQANLIDVEILEDGRYTPSSIVLEPDLLYTVTAIADCFGAFTNHEAGFLLKKFTPVKSSPPLLIGNLVNYFLDQIVFQADLSFDQVISTLFAIDPLGITLLEDEEVKEMLKILQVQFSNISTVVNHQFVNIGVASDTCLVEPTFYSAKYGIQGRLDLFAEGETSQTIIELKSGSPFKANTYGLSNTHYHQTLLYDMLIESVYGPQSKRNNFILYSKEKKKPLRYAPPLKAEQREIIKARNRLYLHDRHLQSAESIIDYIRTYCDSRVDHIKGYQRKELGQLFETFDQLDDIEKKYANALVKFVINEWFISKIGHYNREGSSGLSSLWNQSLNEKKEQYNILNELTLSSNQSDQNDPKLILAKSDKTSSISNFRVGDLGVLYPHKNRKDAILKNQIFKITILAFQDRRIVVRLRSRQDNPSIFKKHSFWNIEHDHLDNGYTNMTRSVYEWARAPQAYRQLIMGLRKPDPHTSAKLECSPHLSEEQSSIFSKIIQSKEYYLLWGPPGTGKTSVMLRELMSHYYHHRRERLLIMAYTNRAVDEICHAILSIDPTPNFIRIGSQYSTATEFKSYLLQSQIEKIKSRQVLRELLESERIYVGTIASILGKNDLFHLVSFDLAIIDEASQILEHALIGILSRVKKFVLIGDHQQLPAVVQQSPRYSTIKDEELDKIRISDLRNSLFERLYATAQSHNWTHAYGKLTFQGRMHYELMQFPSEYFYNHELQTLPKLKYLNEKLSDQYSNNEIKNKILNSRLIFIPSQLDIENENIKVNQYEAEVCYRTLRTLIHAMKQEDVPIESHSIGIITPYRAQIAFIRICLEKYELPHREMITIDTVERYQGGARDIIIMSTCMNYTFQLKALVSLSSSGVDRKLNVALTRARQKFVMIGNPDILGQNQLYKKWIEQATEVKMI